MANFKFAYIDSDAEALIINRVDDQGNLVPGYPTITISLADLVAMVGDNPSIAQDIGFKWLYFKDAKNNCAPMKVPVLMGTPIPDTSA